MDSRRNFFTHDVSLRDRVSSAFRTFAKIVRISKIFREFCEKSLTKNLRTALLKAKPLEFWRSSVVWPFHGHFSAEKKFSNRAPDARPLGRRGRDLRQTNGNRHGHDPTYHLWPRASLRSASNRDWRVLCYKPWLARPTYPCYKTHPILELKTEHRKLATPLTLVSWPDIPRFEGLVLSNFAILRCQQKQVSHIAVFFGILFF